MGAIPPGGGAVGVVVCVAAGLATLSRSEGATLPCRVAMTESVMEVTMNSAAATVVALESTVAEPRGPKTVCEPIPPNAPAKSAALPLCNSTTMIRNKHTMT